MSETVSETAIGPLSAIPKGEGRNFVVGGTAIAVFRTHTDAVHACQAACPHLGGPLADGMQGGTLVEGGPGATIMCPLHDRVYDLATGKVLVGECDITVYPARLVGGTIMVAVP
jgi:nitrite reductase (NADH) small subunit